MKKTILLLPMLLVLLCGRAFSETPTTPSFTSLVATSSTISVTFATNDDEITDGYYIQYWPTDDSGAWTLVRIPNPDTVPDTMTYVLKGLESNTEYTVKLFAYDGEDESAATSDTLETKTVSVSVQLVAPGTITVSLSEVPSGVEYIDVYIGTNPVEPDPDTGEIDVSEFDVLAATNVDSDSVVTQNSLANGTYYVLVRLKDSDRSVIAVSDVIAFQVEDFGTLFSSEDIDNGCFIGSTDHPRKPASSIMPILTFLLVITLFSFPYKRLIVSLLCVFLFTSMAHAGESWNETTGDLVGVKVGYFVPSEKLQKDVYDSIVPVSLFYEKKLGDTFSSDITAGFAHAKGYAVTASSSQTAVETTMDLVPLSVSLNANREISDLVTVYAGLGLDYWYFKEKSYYGDTDKNLSGWHGKAGVKLFTGDDDFYGKFGVILEVSYTAMDRFGRNDVDLGGVTYTAGGMYRF
jgi:hypothetical protein